MAQIGGKGTMRRKAIKRTTTTLGLQKSIQEIRFMKKIDGLNDTIDQLFEEDETIGEVAIDYIEDMIHFKISNLTRFDVPKKDYFKSLRNDPLNFFHNAFGGSLEPESTKGNRYLNRNSFQNLKLYFTVDSTKYIMEIFDEIESILKNKSYFENEQDRENQDEPKDELTNNECFEILNLDKSEIPTRETLIKQYRQQSLIYHPDKNPEEQEKYQELFKRLNKAYHQLLRTYYNKQETNKTMK